MLKKLLHSVREYKLATILSPFLMIGEVAMEVTIPTVMESWWITASPPAI